MDFSQLKKNRGKTVEQLSKKMEQESKGGGFKKDERIWFPERDKAGNAQAVIRFLPISPMDADELEAPYVKLFSHAFQGPGGWYIENSRTTLGKDEADPLAELNREEWDDKDEEAKDRVRKRKRKLHYYSNVYIIKDPANPENEGQVRIFRYGKKIFEKLQACLKPKFEDDPKFDPFCFFDGADFRLRMTVVDDYPSYEESKFLEPSQFAGGDEAKMEEVWKQEHALKEIVAEDKFKSYDELKKQLHRALKITGASQSAMESAPSDEAPAPKQQESSAPAPESKAPEQKEEESSTPQSSLDFFKSLAG